MKKSYLFRVLALGLAFALPTLLSAQDTKTGSFRNASDVRRAANVSNKTQESAGEQRDYSAQVRNTKNKAPGDVINYGITFGENGSEKMITSGNYTDISAANGFNAIESGTVTFDPETYTLTLKDAVITAPLRYDKEKSDIDVAEFILNLEGSNQITSRGASIALAYGDVTIKGSGSLKCNSEKDCGIYVLGNHNFKISCTGLIDAEGRWGISGPIAKQGYLRFVNANVKAKGSDASICDLEKIELSDCEIVSPIGAYIENGAVKLDGSDCKEEVVIKPVVNYGITFGENDPGKMITSGNYTDISAANGFDAIESGTVTFDPETYTLTLKDAVITAPLRYNKEKSDIDVAEFIINLEGSNQITSRRASISLAYSDATIKGSGSLKCNSEKDCGIYVLGNHNFKISCTGLIDAEGRWGISGPADREGYLRFVNANVKAKGSDASICDLEKIELSDCEIVSPIDAYIENGTVKLDGSDCKEEVVIKPTGNYGISIGDVEVTSLNYLNITPEGGFPAVKSGRVTYNPSLRTLTLTDAKIENEKTGGNGISFNQNTLSSGADVIYTLVVRGNNTIETGLSAILAAANVLVEGSGSLSLNSRTDCGIYIPSRYTVHINKCEVDAKGTWGIAGSTGTAGETLIVDNATVKAQGDIGSVCDLQMLDLRGCVISGPKSAVWNPEKHAICNPSGNVVTNLVIIEPISNAIEEMDSDWQQERKQPIYDVNGIRLGSDFNDLPKGIYIVGGKKMVKK